MDPFDYLTSPLSPTQDTDFPLSLPIPKKGTHIIFKYVEVCVCVFIFSLEYLEDWLG